MEEGNYIDLDNYQIVQWQWQTGVNPWNIQENMEQTWCSYKYNTSLLIEKAYSQHQQFIDLGAYEIDLQNMVQVRKLNKWRVRRVRRLVESRLMIDLPEPRIIEKEQKTMNEAFGTVQQFLDFIMKRTSEAYELYQKLRKLSLSCCCQDEYQDIVDAVIMSIQKGAELKERITKKKPEYRIRNYIEESKAIGDVIRKNSASLGEFLKVVFKVYTMETFLCYWLNELLRSENWEGVNVLTPYLVCLVYSFKLTDSFIQHEKQKEWAQLSRFSDREKRSIWTAGIDFLLRKLTRWIPPSVPKTHSIVSPEQKLHLFRGSALTNEHIALYDPQKVKYFSWNAITSTSRNEEIAYKYIQLLLADAQEDGERKVGVLFIIETDVVSIQGCDGMIDVSKDSKYPKEQEVIVAPGTVFELQNISLKEKYLWVISLKIKKNFEETQENGTFLGALHDQAVLKENAIIAELPSQRSLKVLELLEGNKLIRKFEIRNSKINEHMMEIIEETRMTTSVKKEDIKLIDNIISVRSLSLLTYYYSTEAMNEICMMNDIIFTDEDGNLKDIDWKTQKIFIGEDAIERFRRNGQLKELWKRIQNESQTIGLYVSMINLKFSDEEIQDFLECFWHLKSLERVDLTLDIINKSSYENLKSLCEILEQLGTLQSLSLLYRLSDEGLNLFEKMFRGMIGLQDLALRFRDGDVSNEGLKSLGNALKSLPSLQNFALDLSCYIRVSDEGLNELKDALIQLKCLEKLYLNFNGCQMITEKGVNHLKSAIIQLTSLKYLWLCLNECKQISNEELKNLKSDLLSLKYLENLSLDLGLSEEI